MPSHARDEQTVESAITERLRGLRAALDVALRDAEGRRDLIEKLRGEVEAICRLSAETSTPSPDSEDGRPSGLGLPK